MCKASTRQLRHSGGEAAPANEQAGLAAPPSPERGGQPRRPLPHRSSVRPRSHRDVTFETAPRPCAGGGSGLCSGWQGQPAVRERLRAWVCTPGVLSHEMVQPAGGELVKQRELLGGPGLAGGARQGRMSPGSRHVLLNRVSKWAKVSYYEL